MRSNPGSSTSKLDTRIDQTVNGGYAFRFRGPNEFAMSQPSRNEIIENALRKQVKLLPNDTPWRATTERQNWRLPPCRMDTASK